LRAVTVRLVLMRRRAERRRREVALAPDVADSVPPDGGILAQRGAAPGSGAPTWRRCALLSLASRRRWDRDRCHGRFGLATLVERREVAESQPRASGCAVLPAILVCARDGRRRDASAHRDVGGNRRRAAHGGRRPRGHHGARRDLHVLAARGAGSKGRSARVATPGVASLGRRGPSSRDPDGDRPRGRSLGEAPGLVRTGSTIGNLVGTVRQGGRPSETRRHPADVTARSHAPGSPSRSSRSRENATARMPSASGKVRSPA